MKRMIVGFVLAVSACGHVARASSEDTLSGRWRGVLMKGVMTNVVQLEIARNGAGYEGKYWGAAPVGSPMALTEIQDRPRVHFRIGTVGEFEGAINGGTIEGTFEDGQGSGSFTFEKQPQWDDPFYAP